MRKNKRSSQMNPVLACGVIVLVLMVLGVGLMTFAAWSIVSPKVATAPTPTVNATLELAYSPEKETLMTDVVARFNKQNLKTPSGLPMKINATKMDAAEMVDAARDGKFNAISPDSSLWLGQVDAGLDRPLVSEATRIAVTPVVIAKWDDVARGVGCRQKQIGWKDMLNKARTDANFKWSHPSTSSASGLLATLAEFYAGANKTRNLTEDDIKNRATLDYVNALEKTVRYYGEGEQATIDQVLAKGKSYLDAFVVSERMVIYHNTKSPTKLVAIYPVEGTLWQDHPLALLEQPNLTDDQRLTYRRLRDFLLSPEIQKLILQAGYRPVDLGLRLDDPASPIKTANGVDPAQPQTTLQMPNATVIAAVQETWLLAKRPANILLVVDTSGSMGEQGKLRQAQDALETFLDQIQGDRDRVGLVPFSSRVYDTISLQDISPQRTALKNRVRALKANGQTALLDAVSYAYDDLQRRGDKDRINAIVAMTDGIENASSTNTNALVQKIRRTNASGTPVIIFSIAYGNDADFNALNALAEVSGGFSRKADTETIRKLYKILSTYF